MTKRDESLSTLDEVATQIDLEGIKIVYVEGETDQRFYTAWAIRRLKVTELELIKLHKILIQSVNNVDTTTLSDDDNLNSNSNRTNVIRLAKEAHSKNINIRCIADRDVGHDCVNFNYPTLLWTDFPAIESYAVTPQILDSLNLLHLSRSLPDSRELIPQLSFALRKLFAVRKTNNHLPRPKYKKGLEKNSSSYTFDVTKTVSHEICHSIPANLLPSDLDDPRTHSYGHDIAELLMAAYSSKIKNRKDGAIKDVVALENAMRNCILMYCDNEPLFTSLYAWLTDSN